MQVNPLRYALGVAMIWIAQVGAGPAWAQSEQPPTPIGPAFDIGEGYNPAVTRNAAGGFVVAWEYHGFVFRDGVYGRRYNADGTPKGDTFRVGAGINAGMPGVAMDADGQFAVVWTAETPAERTTRLTEDSRSVFFRAYKADGAPRGQPTVLSSRVVSPADIGMADDGHIVVAWSQARNLLRLFRSAPGARLAGPYVHVRQTYFFQRFSAEGAPLGAPRRVATTARLLGNPVGVANPRLGVRADGSLVIVYGKLGRQGRYGRLFVKRYSAPGVSQLLLARRINGRVLDLGLSAVAPAVGISRNSGMFVAAWLAKSTSDRRPSFDRARVFSPQAKALTKPFDVAEIAPDAFGFLRPGLIDAAVAPDGAFSICPLATRQKPDRIEYNVLLSQFSADASRQSPLAVVDQASSDNQSFPNTPQCAVDGDGATVVVYEVLSRGFGDDGHFMRRRTVRARLYGAH